MFADNEYRWLCPTCKQRVDESRAYVSGKLLDHWNVLQGRSRQNAYEREALLNDGMDMDVEEVKDIIRQSSGAKDFLSRATQAGWKKIKEDFIGIYLQKGDATLIFGVLPSHGSDTIWNAMMMTKDTGTVYLITEGKIVI